MSLINCPECGKEISEHAISCPNCGYPIKDSTSIEDTQMPLQDETHTEEKDQVLDIKNSIKSKKFMIVAALALLIVIVVITVVFLPNAIFNKKIIGRWEPENKASVWVIQKGGVGKYEWNANSDDSTVRPTEFTWKKVDNHTITINYTVNYATLFVSGSKEFNKTYHLSRDDVGLYLIDEDTSNNPKPVYKVTKNKDITETTEKEEPRSINIQNFISAYEANAAKAKDDYFNKDYYFFIKVNRIDQNYAACDVAGNEKFNLTYFTSQNVYFKNSSDLASLTKGSIYKITATITDFSTYNNGGMRITIKNAEIVD